MLEKMLYKRLLCVIFSGMLLSARVHAASGSWLSSPADTNWALDDNWTDSPFPNGTEEIAAFAGYPAGTTDIQSTQSITIGSLVLNPTLGAFITIDFPAPFTLTFDNGSAPQASILIASNQHHAIATPIILATDLIIEAGSSSSLTFTEEISGPHDVNILTDPNTHINYSSANSYTGDTIIQSGYLDLNGDTVTPDPSAENIPGNIFIRGSGNLQHGAGTSNNYAAGAVMTIEGGNVSLNDTTQTLGALYMMDGAVMNASTAPSSLLLTNTTPTLTMSGDSTLSINEITIVNVGIITNDSSRPGAGYIFGTFAPAGFTILDLNGNTNVVINADNNPQEGNNEFDLDFSDVVIQNGSVIKSGSGTLLLEGTLGSITDMAVINGTLQIGRNGSASIVDGPGTITLTGSATLQGFGTLGTSGNATVVNSAGNVLVGAPFLQGTLTISGNYEQLANGNLFVQATNTATVNTLIIEDGSVELSGNFFLLSFPGANFSPGDEIVVIDNTSGTGITGTFTNFIAQVPSGLTASLIYNENDVRVLFSSCIPTIEPPASISATQIQNRFAVQRDIINQISWQASPTAGVTGYRIYRNGVVIGANDAHSPLIFNDHNQQVGEPYTYGVTAIGLESAPALTVIS